MTDSELQKLMDRTDKAARNHVKLLRELEDEYKTRFGSYPSDWDDDNFIDTFSYAQGKRQTVKDLTEGALLQKGRQ